MISPPAFKINLRPVSTQLLLTLFILVVAAGLLLSDRVRADLVALLVVVALGVSGVLSPREAFSGFSSSAVVTMAAIFVLVGGLQITGMTAHAGALLQRLAGTSERRLLVAVLVIGALLSLFMNNIAAAAILLPAVSGIAGRTHVRLSHLLMPLAFATLLGGMATLFTTTNIIASGILRTQNLPALACWTFSPWAGRWLSPGSPFWRFGGSACCRRGMAWTAKAAARSAKPTLSASIAWANACFGRGSRPVPP